MIVMWFEHEMEGPRALSRRGPAGSKTSVRYVSQRVSIADDRKKGLSARSSDVTIGLREPRSGALSALPTVAEEAQGRDAGDDQSRWFSGAYGVVT